MNFLVAHLPLLQQYRGNSTTFNEYNESFSSLDWFKLLLVIAVIAIIISFIKGIAAKKEENSIAAVEKTKKNENIKKEEERIKSLNGVYEKSDILEGSEVVYLNLIFVKKILKEYNDLESPFKHAKSREDLNRRLKQSNYSMKERDNLTYPYRLNGFVNIRNEFGIISTKRHYLNGQSDYSIYYDNHGEPKEGRWFGEYENGQLSSECHYLNGKQHGNQSAWYEDGKLNYEWHYIHGKETGVTKCWYENGQLHYEKNYENGKKHGRYIFYKKDGELDFEWLYDKGIQIY